MTSTISIDAQGGDFILTRDGKAMLTPGRHPLRVPSRALAQGMAAEWEGKEKFKAADMPLTVIAYIAIDRLSNTRAQAVDALLAYLDTDALCYREDAPLDGEESWGKGNLALRQTREWDPVLRWAEEEYGTSWHTASGIMPMSQPDALHAAVRKRLEALDTMALAAACAMAPGLSSLALMLATLDKHLSAEEAFRLSRLEEEVQAERWGRDAEAERRAARIGREVAAAGEFLRLLDAA